MRNLILLFVLGFAVQLSAQNLTVANIDCDDTAGQVTFTMTWTDGSSPLSFDGSDVSAKLPTGSPAFFIDVFSTENDGVEGSSIENLRVVADLRVDCDDIIGTELTFCSDFVSVPNETITFSEFVIPTMGQWALFLLGLLMTTLGVVYIRKTSIA